MIADWILRKLLRLNYRDITNDAGDIYMRRYYLYRGKHRPHVFIHHIRRSDEDRALHDHPFGFVSILLTGQYREIRPLSQVANWLKIRHDKAIIREDPVHGSVLIERHRAPAILDRRDPNLLHRLEVDKPVWSLVFAGPRVREWGFMMKQGWVKWTEFGKAVKDAMGM